MSFGSSAFATSPFGGSTGSFTVDQAVALNPYTVQVTFSTDVEGNATTLNPANYQISGIQVLSVMLDPDPNRIRLVVSFLDYVTYTLTVSTVLESAYGDELSSLGNVVNFSGWPKDVGFTARAVSDRAIQVLFAQPMLASTDISTTSNFIVTDLTGAPVPVLSAVPNNNSNILRVRLNLGAQLVAGKPYALHITDQIVTAENRKLVPSNANVTWHQPKSRVTIPMSRFTGEVRSVAQNNRSVAESLTLQESVGILVEPSTQVGNVGVLLSDTFEEGGAGQEGLVASPPSTGIVGASITQNVRVRTRVEPFDPARPNYNPAEELALHESVQVVREDAITGAKEHDFSSEEKLTLTESFEAERARSYLVSETLTLRESVTITPEPRSGLHDSTLELFGTPNGQVFFSPSLVPSAPGPSTISLDDVQVCTRAYDVYKPPPEIDPAPLYTHGGGILPTPPSVLSGGFVLFAKFERLTGAKTNVTFKPSDAPARPVDIGASITLTQTYDPARFSLLNNEAWHLFDNTGLPFVVADNLSPVGAPVVTTPTSFANPAEDYQLVEGLATAAALSVSVSESLTLVEETHQFPGVNQVVVALSETLNLSDNVTPTP